MLNPENWRSHSICVQSTNVWWGLDWGFFCFVCFRSWGNF